MKFTVKAVSNMTGLQGVVRDVTLACEKQVAVGYPSDAPGLNEPHYSGNLSVIDVATQNNYGTETIPERNFMDEATRLAEKGTKSMYMTAHKAILQKKFNESAFLHALGKHGADMVKKAIATGEYVPNAPVTVERKGRDEPLIETTHMYDSATYTLRKISSYSFYSRLFGKNNTSKTKSWDFVKRTLSR